MKPMLAAPVFALMALGLACNRHETEQAPERPSRQVRLVVAQTGAGQGWVAATLTATQRAVLSTRMAASIRKIHVTEGQHVAAGALLVSLSDEDLQAGFSAVQAALASATAHHRRIKSLYDLGASTASELEMAQTQMAQAQAAVVAARANLSYTQIRAPFAGVVQARRVNDGDFAGPGTPLVELEGQGAIELQGSVSEAEAKGLKMGQKVPFEADGRSGMAEITGLSTGGDPVSHRGTIRARVLANEGEPFRTGTFARIQVPGTAAKGEEPLFVPKQALVNRGELVGVFVAKDGHAHLRWLSLGEAQGDRFPVRAGLVSGESVIDQPGDLKDGQPIEVLK